MTAARRGARASAWLPSALVAVVALVAVAAVAGVLVLRGVGPLRDPSGCAATVGAVTAKLSTEQAENATLIAAVGVRRGLPARAVSIALATAFQESKLRNLAFGDRDSVGLFQQRPSMGWGSPRQLRNPYYAANAFYDELVTVQGYADMRITEAAQRVQRSAFPEAYEDHAADARALASALTGYSAGQFSCVAHPDDESASPRLRANGLTPRADEVRRVLDRAFGDLSLGGFAPGGVSSGHMPGSAHYSGRAVDVFVRPVSPPNNRKGWAMAHFLVAHAERLRIATVIFDDRIWTSGRRSEEGWRDYDPPQQAGDQAILEHLDHVHVDVLV